VLPPLLLLLLLLLLFPQQQLSLADCTIREPLRRARSCRTGVSWGCSAADPWPGSVSVGLCRARPTTDCVDGTLELFNLRGGTGEDAAAADGVAEEAAVEDWESGGEAQDDEWADGEAFDPYNPAAYAQGAAGGGDYDGAESVPRPAHQIPSRAARMRALHALVFGRSAE
jgi:hypothetical protein